MTTLITLQGPEAGRKFPLKASTTVLGRQFDANVCLPSKAVSRQHARILLRDGDLYVEDLGSSNGTYLNGVRLRPRSPASYTERDTLQIGPYTFAVRKPLDGTLSEGQKTCHEPLGVSAAQHSIYSQDSGNKLQVVLEIAQGLGRALELEPLLDKLLEQLKRLFPQADRALVILCEGEDLVLRAQRGRHNRKTGSLPFSRTVVRKALAEGVGLISEDVQEDGRFEPSQTLTSLDLHSILCVPLITQEGKPLGVLQMDRYHQGSGFRNEDLQLLTVVGLQVTVALENAALHAERLTEQRLHQELELARDIQDAYLPQELEGFPAADFEVFGRVYPARSVAGDLYDFFKLPDGRLAFFIGDVSGKGMPAALFMVAVRTLYRHLAKEPGTPAQILTRLHDALADDNPNCMFVTLIHGIYDPATGVVVVTSAGHPAPILRKADGSAEVVPLASGRLLGYEHGRPNLTELALQLSPGDTLVFYTDGMLEARLPSSKDQFGVERIKDVVCDFQPTLSLADCADMSKAAIDVFTGSKDLQDDLTLLILRVRESS